MTIIIFMEEEKRAIKEKWHGAAKGISVSFDCAYCGKSLASVSGIESSIGGLQYAAGYIRICHFCGKPTYLDNVSKTQHPGAVFGEPVENIAEDSVRLIYNEARQAYSVGSFTAAVMCCRLLLMHIAIDKGAKERETFKEYVSYLVTEGYVGKPAEEWVTRIKDLGNEANHEIAIKNPEEAKTAIKFCEMLLKLVYEYPAEAKETPY